MFLDQEKEEFQLRAARGKEGDSNRLFETQLKPLNLKIGEGIAGYVALEKQSVLSPDTRHDEWFLPPGIIGEKEIGSMLCLSLVIKG